MTQATASTQAATVATDDTDDRGEYRLPGLPAGTFVVAITTLGNDAADGQRQSGRHFQPPQTTYYPGGGSPADAQELRLQYGEDRPGVDFVVVGGRSFSGISPVILSLQQLRPPQQNPNARAAIVRGRVTTTDGRRVANAQVLLIGTRRADSQVATTDNDGRFELREVAAGNFKISADKFGYAPIESGQLVAAGPNRLDSGLALDLAAGEVRERIDLTLAPWGTLSGRVSDESGDPIQGASVQVLQVRYEAGRGRLVPARAATRVTDDLGRYRIYNLAPGQYIVSAAVGQVFSEDIPGYARSFYPGTAIPAEARFVTVGLSQDVRAVDFDLSRVRTARVAGQTFNSAGEPATPGTLMLTSSQRSSSVTNVPVGARISQDGTFEFLNVPPGQYVIQAYRGRSNPHTEGEFGALPVSVSGADMTGLHLQMASGSTIAGRVIFDAFDRTRTPTPSEIDLATVPVDFDLSPQNNLAEAEIHSDWTFEMAGLNGPRRLELLRAPPDGR